MSQPEDQPDVLRGAERHRQVGFQIPFSVAMHLAISLRVEQMEMMDRVGDICPEAEQLWWIAADKFPTVPLDEPGITETQRKVAENVPYGMQLSFAEIEAVGRRIIQDFHLQDEMRFFDPWVPMGFSDDAEMAELAESTRSHAKQEFGAFQQTYQAFIQAGGLRDGELLRRIVFNKRSKHLGRG